MPVRITIYRIYRKKDKRKSKILLTHHPRDLRLESEDRNDLYVWSPHKVTDPYMYPQFLAILKIIGLDQNE